MLIQTVDQRFNYIWFVAQFTSDGAGAGSASFPASYPLNRFVAYMLRGAASNANGTFTLQQTGTTAAQSWPNDVTPAKFPAPVDVEVDFPADLQAFRAGQTLTFTFAGLPAATVHTFGVLVQVPTAPC